MFPKSITTGESFDWTKELPDYPASDGWVVTYYFRGPATLDVVGTPSGSEYSFAVTPTQSAGLTSGRYSYQAFAVKSTTDKKLVCSGVIEVKASLVNASAGYDGRSVNEVALENITLALKGVAADGVQGYVIQTPHGSREIRNYSLAELMELHKYFGRLVDSERRAKSGQSVIDFEFFSFGNS